MNSQVHELKLMNSKFMNLTNFMNLAISCSWIVHELFMNKCSWTAHELFKNHSWTVHDHFTGAGRGIPIGLIKDGTLQGRALQSVLQLPTNEQKKLPQALQKEMNNLAQFPPEGKQMPETFFFCRVSGEYRDQNCKVCANRKHYNIINGLI